MFNYYFSSEKIYWDNPILKYVPDPFQSDNWLNFKKLPENTKVNFINFENCELFIPFDNFEQINYIKVENEKMKLYYFIDKVKYITKKGVLYNLKLDYYMSYCIYIIKKLNRSNIFLKRLGQPKINFGDHVILNNFKKNMINDNLIKSEELVYSSNYEEKTIINKNYVGMRLVKGDETDEKQLYLWNQRPKKGSISKYGMYMVFLYKNKETPESVFHCFPIITYNTNEYLIGSNNEQNGYYLGNCLMTPVFNSTRYGLTKLLSIPDYQNSFIGVFRGPMLTMREIANKNFDYYYYLISSGFGETGYIFISLTNLQQNNFSLNLKDDNLSIIDYNMIFFKDPYKLFNKIVYFNEELLQKDIFTFPLTINPSFSIFFNNGFCYATSYINNENGYQNVLTNGSVLATNTSNLADQMINNRNLFNSGLIQQGFSLINKSVSPSNWNWGGVISSTIGGVQGIGDLIYKNSINEANVKNIAQNVDNLEYKKSQDFFKLINILTKNKTEKDKHEQYFWINELSDRDKQKINLLYDENGMLYNNNINFEDYISKIKQSDENRLYLSFLIDWTFYVYKIKSMLNDNSTDYFPNFDSEIVKKCIELMSNSLIICLKNRIE